MVVAHHTRISSYGPSALHNVSYADVFSEDEILHLATLGVKPFGAHFVEVIRNLLVIFMIFGSIVVGFVNVVNSASSMSINVYAITEV